VAVDEERRPADVNKLEQAGTLPIPFTAEDLAA
jgi:hypothetical protein